MKRTFWLFLICLLVGGRAQAQTAAWSVWLFNQDTGVMTRVDSGGVAQSTVTLPTSENYVFYGERVAVSPDGRYMAYNGVDPDSYGTRGLLYDSQTGALQTLYPLAGHRLERDSLALVANSAIFSDTGVAVGYSLAGGGWVLYAQDFSGARRATLESLNPLVVTLGLPSAAGMTPVIQRYAGTEILFTLVDTSGSATTSAALSYSWDTLSGALRASAAYPTMDSDTLSSTGEVVSAGLNPDFPNRTADYPAGQANTLEVYWPQRSARFALYSEANLTLFRPRFVENGRRLLVGAFDEFNTIGEWRLLERSGQPAQPQIILRMAEIIIADAIGIYDGFVYVTASLSTDGTFTLMHVDTRDGLDTGSIVWIGAPGARQRLVWAGDTRAAAPSDTPFMAWGQIGAAQQTGISPLELPTAPAANNAGLLAGGTATINTTEGDQLNVRSGPGIDFGVVGRLADGTRVTLVEGPRAADGLRWWRIRVGDIEGWVVESVEDGGALIQTLIAGG